MSDLVLIAVADPLRRLVELSLRGLAVSVAIASGPDVRAEIERTKPSLVVAEWRDHGSGLANVPVPVLAVVHKPGPQPKIDALAAGADEVVGVPFDMPELALRAAAAIGRAHGRFPAAKDRIDAGPVWIDGQRGTVHLDGTMLRFSPLEQRIFLLLLANEGSVTARDRILEAVWGVGMEPNSNLIDRHIRDLRRKLSDDWRRPSFIVTVRGRGYAFRDGETPKQP